MSWPGAASSSCCAVTAGDPAAERAALQTLAEHSAAGVIVVGADDSASEDLRALSVPTVHLARRPPHLAGDCVLGDDIAGARLAAEHLLGLGHRRIAIIAGPGSNRPRRTPSRPGSTSWPITGLPGCCSATSARDLAGPRTCCILASPTRTGAP